MKQDCIRHRADGLAPQGVAVRRIGGDAIEDEVDMLWPVGFEDTGEDAFGMRFVEPASLARRQNVDARSGQNIAHKPDFWSFGQY